MELLQRRPRREYAPSVWAEAKRRFEAGEHRAQLAEALDISHSALSARASREGWKTKREAAEEQAVASGAHLPSPLATKSGPEPEPTSADTLSPTSAVMRLTRTAVTAAEGGRPQHAVLLARAAALLRRAWMLGRTGGDTCETPEAARDDAAAREAAWAAWMGGAHDPQKPPEGDWSTWLFLGGRGAGKTRAGAEWIGRQAVPGARLALVGQSLHDVREVMVDGESGLIACAAADTLRPKWESSRRRLLWPNGAFAQAFSAEDADGLRGPQFHAAWCDEWAAWKQPEHALAMLRMGLRLGQRPRVMISTTPRPHGALRRLLAEEGTVVSRGATSLNAKFLAPSFLSDLERRYGGTRLGRQELEGIVVEGDGAPLWRAEQLAACAGAAPEPSASGRAVLERIVVAVDPPAGSGQGSACGIVVAGRLGEKAFVLADRTVERSSPAEWADAVRRAAEAYSATAVVAEANQGGEMVKAVLTGAGVRLPVKLVRASEGKRARAEPVAALYEQGRVTHCASMPELEEQMLGLGAEEECARGEGGGSPDRADALVWGLSELMLGPCREGPRIRVLDW